MKTIMTMEIVLTAIMHTTVRACNINESFLQKERQRKTLRRSEKNPFKTT